MLQKRHQWRLSFLPAWALLTAACGGDGTAPRTRIAGTAHVIHGAGVSPGASPTLLATRLPAGGPVRTTVPADGHWGISPEQGRVTIDHLVLVDTGGHVVTVALTGCKPTYVRSAQSLSAIIDCPFTVPSGQYVEVDLAILNTFEILIDDATHGLYTDPTSSSGLSTAPPANGAQFVTLTIPVSSQQQGLMQSQQYLASPLVVDSMHPPVVNLVVDMLHTVYVNVTGGVPSFDTSLPQPAVIIVPSIQGVGRAEFYSGTGTALNTLMPGSTDNDSRSARVYYSGAQPMTVISPVIGPSEAWNADPATSNWSSAHFRAGGYLGLDGSGTLCWALPTDYTYAQYGYLRRMVAVSTLGGSTTLSTKQLTMVPKPTSGSTYASGCPAFTPDESHAVWLVAR